VRANRRAYAVREIRSCWSPLHSITASHSRRAIPEGALPRRAGCPRSRGRDRHGLGVDGTARSRWPARWPTPRPSAREPAAAGVSRRASRAKRSPRSRVNPRSTSRYVATSTVGDRSPMPRKSASASDGHRRVEIVETRTALARGRPWEVPKDRVEEGEAVAPSASGASALACSGKNARQLGGRSKPARPKARYLHPGQNVRRSPASQTRPRRRASRERPDEMPRRQPVFSDTRLAGW